MVTGQTSAATAPPAARRRPSISRHLASIPTWLVYGFVRVLVVVAPRPRRDQDPLAPPPARRGGGSLLIRWTVALYRHSSARDHLHRHGSNCCLFLPTCSEYAVRAGEKYGFFKALMLIGDRMRRCRADTKEAYVDFP